MKAEFIVIIPAWNRPEFLAACLDYIKRADAAEQNVYYFCLDEGFARDVFDVIEPFPFWKKVVQRQTRHSRSNSGNILAGYEESLALAQQYSAPLISLIEDDIFIGKDFFAFHKLAHSQFDPFVVSGCRNQNFSNALPSDPESVYLHHRYQSLGVSFKPQAVKKIAFHNNRFYYENPETYINAMFSKRGIPGTFTEQDALCDLIMENEGLQGIYPFVPRAFHAGFTGYGARKGVLPSGDWRERSEKIKAMSEAELNDSATTFKDITVCDLNGHSVKCLNLVTV